MQWFRAPVEFEEMRRRLREETSPHSALSLYSIMMCIVGRAGGDAETVTGGDGGAFQGGGAGARGTVFLNTVVTSYFNVILFRRFDATGCP